MGGINKALHQAITHLNIPFKKFGPIIRVALTGETNSPGLAEVINVMGKLETLARLQMAKSLHVSA